LTGPRFQIREPRTDEEWQAYYALRWRILRAPWQQQGPERDETDAGSIHRMVYSPEQGVIAVGRLHRVNATTGQIRFMAVDTGRQRHGIGSQLLGALEDAAPGLALNQLILQARESAVPFYTHHGYRVLEKTFLLFDEIQHYLMQKTVNH